MLSNLSPYSPQGFIPQFAGLQPGAYAGYVPFAHEPALTGMYPSQFLQTPFAPTPFGPSAFAPTPFGPSAFAPTPFAPTPFGPSAFAPTPFAPAIAYNPLLSLAGYAGAHHPAQQIVLVLGQLAQQISVQTALTQQISIALQQLVQQLAVQGLHPGASLGAFGGQYFAQNPFTGATQGAYGQGAYGGFTPQAQVWGANRAQTIQ